MPIIQFIRGLLSGPSFLLMGFILSSVPSMEAAEGSWSLREEAHGSTLVSPAGRDILGYLKTKPAGSGLSANSACGVYPLLTPAGESVVALAPKDHPHHRGVFFAWYEINGREKADFWGWGAHAPTQDRVIVNTDLRLVESKARRARLLVTNEWRISGRTVLRESLTLVTRMVPEGNWHEFTFTLVPTENLTIPRAAFSGFCVKGKSGQQPIMSNPEGPVTLAPPKYDDPTTGWPNVPWYDYTVTLDSGKRAGVAALSHPSNPPTQWHNPIGIGMLNPCHLMEGDLSLKSGQPLVLRYALLVHDGPVPTAALNRLSKAFARSNSR